MSGWGIEPHGVAGTDVFTPASVSQVWAPHVFQIQVNECPGPALSWRMKGWDKKNAGKKIINICNVPTCYSNFSQKFWHRNHPPVKLRPRRGVTVGGAVSSSAQSLSAGLSWPADCAPRSTPSPGCVSLRIEEWDDELTYFLIAPSLSAHILQPLSMELDSKVRYT